MMNNTISEHLIAFLLSARSVTIYRHVLWELLKERQRNAKNASFQQYLYRLNKKNIIKTEGDIIYLNKKKLTDYAREKNLIIKNIYPAKTQEILIAFDIPENKKIIRNWLRRQLRYWNFKMVQKSLWSGFGPLPKEFTAKLKKFEINKNVKIFKLIKKIQ